MPLAIGGGLLLLFMGLKKANAQDASSLPALPQMDDNNAANQINPDPAPKYTDQTEDENTNEPTSAESATSSGWNQNSTSENYPSADQDDEQETAPTPYPETTVKSSATKNTASQGSNKGSTASNRPVYAPTASGKAQKMSPTARQAAANAKAQKMRFPNAGPNSSKITFQKQRNGSAAKMPIPLLKQMKKMTVPIKPTATIFPLKQGQTNNYIKEVQRRIGVPPTGFFGTQTRSALLKRYKATEISEALFKQIISGKAPVRPVNKIHVGKKAPPLKRSITINKKK